MSATMLPGAGLVAQVSPFSVQPLVVVWTFGPLPVPLLAFSRRVAEITEPGATPVTSNFR